VQFKKVKDKTLLHFRGFSLVWSVFH